MAVRPLDLAASLDRARAAMGLPPLRPDLVGPDECSPASDLDHEVLSARYFHFDPAGRHGFRSTEQAAHFIAAGCANRHRWRFGGPRLDLCGARPRKNGKRKSPCRRVRVKGQKRCPLHGGYSKKHRRPVQRHGEATMSAMGYRLRYAERQDRQRELLSDSSIAELFPAVRWARLSPADRALVAHTLAKESWTADDFKNLDYLIFSL